MDYFNYGNRRRGNSVTQERLNAPLPPAGGPRTPSGQPSRESLRPPRAPSGIRIRRLPSGQVPQTPGLAQEGISATDRAETGTSGRRRSTSEPQRPTHVDGAGVDLERQRTYDGPQMATLSEESPGLKPSSMHPGFPRGTPEPATPGGGNPSRPAPVRGESGVQAMQGAGNAARSARGMNRFRSTIGTQRQQPVQANEYDADVVNLLDLIDPEVGTLNTLTNMQNSLFVPDLGSWLNRRPTYELTQRPSGTAGLTTHAAGPRPRSRAGTRAAAEARQQGAGLQPIQQGEETQFQDDMELDDQETASRRASISSNLSDTHYAVLPHGVQLAGWSEEDKAELNDHVRHLLHSRREGFKRSWRGFRKYVSKPLGFFVTFYAALVTIFGTVWVFLLIGWIYAGNSRQDYIINIIDNILVALFALIGDGMAPFRIVDTYHMCFIANYHHKTWARRQKKGLPKLQDENDLPKEVPQQNADLEAALQAPGETEDDKVDHLEFSVLSPAQQARLQYHQDKFSKSHTFYKPHETATHHAFPLRLLVAIVVLLDCHSCFQVALGTCTWSINYHVRSEALTSSILACSLTCNIVAGIIISIGDKRTRKKDVLERMFRQDLTTEAIRKIHKRKTADITGRPSMGGDVARDWKDDSKAEVKESKQEPYEIPIDGEKVPGTKETVDKTERRGTGS